MEINLYGLNYDSCDAMEHFIHQLHLEQEKIKLKTKAELQLDKKLAKDFVDYYFPNHKQIFVWGRESKLLGQSTPETK